MAHKMNNEDGVDEVKAALSVFDLTGDGYLSAEEMRRIMINVGEPVTLDDVEQVIRSVDVNGDGVVDYEELTKVLGDHR